jgi:hypothetical protein
MSLTNFEDLDEMLDSLHEDHSWVLNKIKQYAIEFPIKSARLESEYSIGGPGIRKIIRYYRLKGVPIGSSSKGYYLARNKEEYDLTLAHLKERAIKELELVSVGEKINWNHPAGEQVSLGL